MSAPGKKRNISKLFLIGVLGICLIFTIAPRVKSIYDLTEQKKVLEQQKRECAAKNQLLQEKKEAADSLGNIEKIAREQLGMVKPGESAIVGVAPTE